MDETSWELFTKECGIKPKILYKYYSEIKSSITDEMKGVSGFPYDYIKAIFKERSKMLRKCLNS